MQDKIPCVKQITAGELLYVNETLRCCLVTLTDHDVTITYDLEEMIRESHKILSSILGGKNEDTGNPR
jgi:hypothetical protein